MTRDEIVTALVRVFLPPEIEQRSDRRLFLVGQPHPVERGFRLVLRYPPTAVRVWVVIPDEAPKWKSA